MKPRIICCFTKLHPSTFITVKKYAPTAEFVCTAGNDYTYRDVIREYWTGESDLITIEQDNVITPKVVKSFTRCRKPWCVYSYQGPPQCGYLYRSLGCTKFSAKLQQQVPFDDFDTEGMVWQYIDAKINGHFWFLDIKPHVHGHIEHYHDYSKDEVVKPQDQCVQVEPDGKYVLYENYDGWKRGKRIREVLPGSFVPGDNYGAFERVRAGKHYRERTVENP